MFEPLPGLIRLRREQRNLTQEGLAKLAKVSRGQLIAFEKGGNVTLHFLLKVARALDMTDLPLAELNLRPAAPDITVLVTAVNAISTAERMLASVASSTEQVREASAAVRTLMDRALAASDRHQPEIAAAADRLARTPAADRAALASTVREVASVRSPQSRASRTPREVKAAARKRNR